MIRDRLRQSRLQYRRGHGDPRGEVGDELGHPTVRPESKASGDVQ